MNRVIKWIAFIFPYLAVLGLACFGGYCVSYAGAVGVYQIDPTEVELGCFALGLGAPCLLLSGGWLVSRLCRHVGEFLMWLRTGE